MQHLNTYRFYELAAKLHGLFNGASQHRIADMFGPLTEAQNALDSMIKGDPIVLDATKSDATRLLNKIGSVFNRNFIDSSTQQIKRPTGEDRMDPHEMASIQSLVEKFEHSLAAELNRAPTYVAEKRGIYSTYDLIENAYQTFSPELLAIIPVTAQNEFSIAGRALAFGLGSAATMHLLRAVELVLKQYYELFSGSTVSRTERSYNIYLKKLAVMADDESGAMRPDKRLLQMLAQIKEHYRNPLVSPESNVSIDQATSLFGLATAIITMMAEQVAANQKQSKSNKEDKKSAADTATEAVADVAEEAAESDDDDESFSFKSAKAG